MLARLSATRRLPRVFAVRAYSAGRTEGSVAESRGFNKKEKAHEDQYIRQHEQQQMEKLRAEIAKKQQELASLEEEHKETQKKD